MALSLAECDRVVAAVEAAGVRFLMWNRNTFPSILQAREVLAGGGLGDPRAVHVDFFFAKDAGALLGSGEAEVIPEGHEVLGELTVEGIYPPGLHPRPPRRPGAARLRPDHRPLLPAPRRPRRGGPGLGDPGDGGRHPGIRLHSAASASPRTPTSASSSCTSWGPGRLRRRRATARGLDLCPIPEAEDHRRRRVGVDYERRLLDDFARAIDTGSDTLLTARDGRAIAATVFAAVESGRTGRAVEVAGG